MFKKLKHGVPTARLDFLRSVPLLAGLPDDVLARIDSHVDEVEMPAGSHLTVQGTRATRRSSSSKASPRSGSGTRRSARRRSGR